MTTKDIMNLDYTDEKSKRIIQKVLKQIKPLSKYSDEEYIPLEYIEKAIKVMSSKYQVRVRSIWPDIWSNEKSNIWRAEVVNDSNLDNIGYAYGISIYELFAKVAILMYSEIKKERLKVRG